MVNWLDTVPLTELDVRVWLIIALGLVEVCLTVTSYRSRRRPARFDITFLLLLIIAGAAASRSLEASELLWAFVAAAGVVWANGVIVRHQTWLQSVVNFEWRDRLPWARRLLGIRAIEWYLSSRHPDGVGAALEGIALLLLTARWPIILAGTTVLCVAAWITARLTDRKFDAGTRSYFERDGIRIVPAFRPVGLVALQAFIFFWLVALVTHERVIFYGDAPAASGLLGTAAIIVGSLGVLTITISLVVAQVGAGEVSVRLALNLARDGSLVLTAAVLFIAVSICLGLLARLGDFPSTPANSWEVDMALVTCGAAAACTGWFVWRAPSLLVPENIVASQLGRLFTPWWARQIRDTWGGYVSPRPLWTQRHDPLVVVERVLFRAVDRREGLTVRSTLAQLASYMNARFARDPDNRQLGPGGVVLDFERGGRSDAIALDAYVVDRFGDTIDLAAERAYTLALNALIDLWAYVGPARGSDKLAALSSPRFEMFEASGTPGERFVRFIVAKGVEFGNVEATEYALRQLTQERRPLLAVLPKGQNTYEIYYRAYPDQAPDYAHEDGLTDPERQRRRDNDEKVRAFYEQYVDYYRELSKKAAAKRLWPIVRHAVSELQFIADSVFEPGEDFALQRDLLREVMRRVVDISDDLCELSIEDRRAICRERVFTLFFVRSIAEALTPTTGADMAALLADGLISILETQFAADVLCSSVVSDCAEVSRALIQSFSTTSERFINTFLSLATQVRHAGWTAREGELRWLHIELVEAIRAQIPWSVTGWTQSDIQRMRDKVQSALAELNEPLVAPRLWAASVPISLPPETDRPVISSEAHDRRVPTMQTLRRRIAAAFHKVRRYQKKR